ncbi:MAG TPA: hypothetical protein VGH79_02600 [Gaiellaceae bacterium]|jgi:hypothetical protein
MAGGLYAAQRPRCSSPHNSRVVYLDNTLNEIRHLVPPGKDWAFWEDVNGYLAYLCDAELIELARENERELGTEFAETPLPAAPRPEQAWEYLDALWSGEPGGRGWHVRIPDGATWLALQSDDGDSDRGGPEPTFGFGEPPLDEGVWREPGY